MSEDSAFPPEAYLLAHDVVRHIGQNYAIQYQVDNENMSQDAAKRHFNDRAAILRVQQLLIEAGERVAGV